jgi:hypothetical protein
MTSGSDQDQLGISSLVDQQPVWLDVTLSRAGVSTEKRVITKPWIQHFSLGEARDKRSETREILTPLLHPLRVSLELTRMPNLAHQIPRSANSASAES